MGDPDPAGPALAREAAALLLAGRRWPSASSARTKAAARLPAVLAALVLVGATALVGARLFGAPAGLHAGFVLATSLLAFAYGRAASMDMLLAACVTAGHRPVRPAPLRHRGAPGRARGLRGHGPGHPGQGSAGPAAARPRRPGLRAWRPATCGRSAWPSIPWASWPSSRSPLPGTRAILADQGRHFVDVFLLNHNVARFTSTVHNHPGPIVYYLPVLLAGLFPWSGLVRPRLRGPAAARQPRGPVPPALARPAPRLLLPGRLEAARLRPALPGAPRPPRRAVPPPGSRPTRTSPAVVWARVGWPRLVGLRPGRAPGRGPVRARAARASRPGPALLPAGALGRCSSASRSRGASSPTPRAPCACCAWAGRASSCS